MQVMAEKIKVVISSLLIIVAGIVHAQNTAGGKVPISISTADSFFLARDWQMAKRGYESILKDTSTNSLAWNRLGFANYNLRIYDLAISNYKKSLSLNPPGPLKSLVYSRIAKIKAIQNEKQEAFIALDSAIRVGLLQ